MPAISKYQRENVIHSASRVLEARQAYGHRSLSDLYEDKSMPLELKEAHLELDKVVDELFGLEFPAPSGDLRHAALWKAYERLVA